MQTDHLVMKCEGKDADTEKEWETLFYNRYWRVGSGWRSNQLMQRSLFLFKIWRYFTAICRMPIGLRIMSTRLRTISPQSFFRCRSFSFFSYWFELVGKLSWYGILQYVGPNNDVDCWMCNEGLWVRGVTVYALYSLHMEWVIGKVW